MKLATGDMWSVYHQANLFLVTTNSTLKNDDCLVMGKGASPSRPTGANQRHLTSSASAPTC